VSQAIPDNQLKKSAAPFLARAVLKIMKKISPVTASAIYRRMTGYNQDLIELVELESDKIKKAAAGANNPVFVDCGTNEGVVLGLFVTRLPDFKFVGFEVQKELIKVAENNAPGARIRHQAVGDRNGQVEIYLPKNYSYNYRGGTTTVANKISDERMYEKRPIDSVRLFDVLNELRAAGHDFIVIKLDIEGAEYPIINDLYQESKLQDQKMPIDFLMIEWHPRVLDHPDEQAAYDEKLSDMGVSYSLWV